MPTQRMSRGVRQESDVLLRQLESYLTTLRSARPDADLTRVDRLAASLRQLIADTAQASAVDRGRVRAAVHTFVSRGSAGGAAARARSGSGRFALLSGARPERRVVRDVADDDRVVNELLLELGRGDLVVGD